ncbi:MAG: VWA domain-containing protein, partial [Bacteroidales bacterium]|nr:VWA domain-containing protein [Bacteroidales bacterium]
MKYFWYSLILFFIQIHTGSSQNYEVIDVVSNDFPYVEAYIKATTKVNAEDFKLHNISILEVEKEKILSPIRSKAPSVQLKATPLSVVLALDVSGSMKGSRLDILKSSTKKALQKIPLEISEVAIASFNSNINLNCDFTHNIDTLTKCIDELYADGGTNFENAFLSENIGLIDIAKQGQYTNKLIVFISDGMANVNTHQVISFANQHSIMVSCITIGLPIGEQLKTIAEKT